MLYGFLGKKYGKVHRFKAHNILRVFQLLTANFPTFRRDVIDGGAYKILIGGKQDIGEENLIDPVSDKETIRIIPIVQGSGDNPTTRIIIGAAIMYFSYGAASAQGAAVAAGGAGTATGVAATMAYSFGASLVLGGIYQLLFPAPKIENTDRPDRKASFIFNGAVNTAAQGNPVPVCYGQLIVGSQVISAGLSTQDIPV